MRRLVHRPGVGFSGAVGGGSRRPGGLQAGRRRRSRCHSIMGLPEAVAVLAWVGPVAEQGVLAVRFSYMALIWSRRSMSGPLRRSITLHNCRPSGERASHPSRRSRCGMIGCQEPGSHHASMGGRRGALTRRRGVDGWPCRTQRRARHAHRCSQNTRARPGRGREWPQREIRQAMFDGVRIGRIEQLGAAR